MDSNSQQKFTSLRNLIQKVVKDRDEQKSIMHNLPLQWRKQPLIQNKLRPAFTKEIRCMMYSFGDCKEPLPRSVRLVQKILRGQMNTLLCKATDAALLRGGNEITHEDLLFLMRKNRVKIKRLLNYLEIMDTRDAIMKKSSHEEYKSEPKKGSRVTKCDDFLKEIDQFDLGYLIEEDIEDPVYKERIRRREEMALRMNSKEYIDFTEKSSASFFPKYCGKRFTDWLMADGVTNLVPTKLALEIINYLARETVAEIVDLSLLVKEGTQKKYEFRTDKGILESIELELFENTDDDTIMEGDMSHENIIKSYTSKDMCDKNTENIPDENTHNTHEDTVNIQSSVHEIPVAKIMQTTSEECILQQSSSTEDNKKTSVDAEMPLKNITEHDENGYTENIDDTHFDTVADTVEELSDTKNEVNMSEDEDELISENQSSYSKNISGQGIEEEMTNRSAASDTFYGKVSENSSTTDSDSFNSDEDLEDPNDHAATYSPENSDCGIRNPFKDLTPKKKFEECVSKQKCSTTTSEKADLVLKDDFVGNVKFPNVCTEDANYIVLDSNIRHPFSEVSAQSSRIWNSMQTDVGSFGTLEEFEGTDELLCEETDMQSAMDSEKLNDTATGYISCDAKSNEHFGTSGSQNDAPTNQPLGPSETRIEKYKPQSNETNKLSYSHIQSSLPLTAATTCAFNPDPFCLPSPSLGEISFEPQNSENASPTPVIPKLPEPQRFHSAKFLTPVIALDLALKEKDSSKDEDCLGNFDNEPIYPEDIKEAVRRFMTPSHASSLFDRRSKMRDDTKLFCCY